MYQAPMGTLRAISNLLNLEITISSVFTDESNKFKDTK